MIAGKIEFGRGRLTGQPYAQCMDCGWMCVYWEDNEDLEHECKGDKCKN